LCYTALKNCGGASHRSRTLCFRVHSNRPSSGI